MTYLSALPTSVSLSGRILELDLLADDLAECLIGLGCRQTAVEVDRGLDIAVAEQPLDGLVFTGAVLEIDRRTGMAELVNCHLHACRLLDTLSDLGAEHVRRLGLTGDAGEQPGRVGAACQGWFELVDVFINEPGESFVERKFEVDPVLD